MTQPTDNRREALLATALTAAERGWHVFPLRPGTKRPALHGERACAGTGPCESGHRKWEQRATTDPDRIRAAWSRAPFNVGIATGPSGLLVVDLDTPEHKARQEALREAAGDEWEEHGAVFTRPDGRPLAPRADWEEFKELLAEAGIDDRRLYDGSRHTAGTILNELGVDMVTIMEILRHTQISQTRRYVKGRSHLSKDAMRRMGDTFLPSPQTPTETTTETLDTRAARAARRRVR